MAYRRKSYSSRARRPIGRSAKRGGARRRYPTKKRTYRKNRAMSTRTILNKTSRKKRNGMLTWANTSTSGTSIPNVATNYFLTGNLGGRSIWCATAQDLTVQDGSFGTVALAAARTSTSCYMKGLSEHIRIQTSTGLPWFWRRICFTLKGDDLFRFSTSDTPTSTSNRYLDTTGGMQRLFFNELNNAQSNTINNHDAIIFKGAKGIDWIDYIVAPIDTSRINLKYDKVTLLRSGNANGTIKEAKLWHGMNKNLQYDDDESGDKESTSYTSVDSKIGMGDYFVMDMFYPGAGGAAADIILVQANSTLYWHEK
ncbi:capsid protein [Gerygone associated gemycircularvirus 2]|uniref:Capsid protein n=1 Tax=Gerygone associated gemycircularvirus 2 TaxID=1985382 RepID=T1YRW5_9VIRU|nr:capsid protein [Gerygone associated gemycircularvirus 2]AGU67660.1 capsid protein [Gerygone associated gemycircularvirus 2]